MGIDGNINIQCTTTIFMLVYVGLDVVYFMFICEYCLNFMNICIFL